MTETTYSTLFDHAEELMRKARHGNDAPKAKIHELIDEKWRKLNSIQKEAVLFYLGQAARGNQRPLYKQFLANPGPYDAMANDARGYGKNY